jgi:acetolactate decarboxylase
MANLAVRIPSSLEAAARGVPTQRKTSLDSLVGAALSEYLHFSPRRMYQISTSTALVEDVYSGSVSCSALLDHGDFGVGTFEGLNGHRRVLQSNSRHKADSSGEKGPVGIRAGAVKFRSNTGYRTRYGV